jgi:hypothetical protein
MTVTIKVSKRRSKDPTLWQLIVLLANIIWLVYLWVKRIIFSILTWIHDKLDKPYIHEKKEKISSIELKEPAKHYTPVYADEPVEATQPKKPLYPISPDNYDFNADPAHQVIKSRNNAIKSASAKRKVAEFIGEDYQPSHEELEAKRIYDRYYKPKSQSWQQRDTDLVDTEAYYDSTLTRRENNELIRNIGREEYRKDQYGY